MKVAVKILSVKTVNEFDFYWTHQDYIQLLEAFGFPDAQDSKEEELLELLHLAITDMEPAEAAEILLNYKLSEELRDGQIQNMSHEMLEDKLAEEYSEPALHFDLFNINQLLYKAFNGTFPNTEASIITVEMQSKENPALELDKEHLLKALSEALRANNLIKRLFEEQLQGKKPFTDAAKTIWKIDKTGDHTYQLYSSKYWIDKEDIGQSEYEATVHLFEEE